MWRKIPDGWYKNPYAWTGIVSMFVFVILFAANWVKWHEYREENRQLKMVDDKHQVTTIMLNELCPELVVTIGAYEELTEKVGVDSTLAVFHRQVEKVKEEDD